mmetsp:Transcript_47792/g.108446  ORF Transcript_47792/g.108446 Transcript_47792/m.108446 type:complete len:330 (+) Transcript_47792:478-1467(+)
MSVCAVLWPGVCMFLIGRYLNGIHEQREAAGYLYLDTDIQFTKEQLGKFPVTAVNAGLAAGLLGIGGGMVIGPLFIEIGMQPQVGTSSCAYMILWTAVSGVVQYYYAGKLGWQFMLFFMAFGFISGQIGQRMVSRHSDGPRPSRGLETTRRRQSSFALFRESSRTPRTPTSSNKQNARKNKFSVPSKSCFPHCPSSRLTFVASGCLGCVFRCVLLCTIVCARGRVFVRPLGEPPAQVVGAAVAGGNPPRVHHRPRVRRDDHLDGGQHRHLLQGRGRALRARARLDHLRLLEAPLVSASAAAEKAHRWRAKQGDKELNQSTVACAFAHGA